MPKQPIRPAIKGHSSTFASKKPVPVHTVLKLQPQRVSEPEEEISFYSKSILLNSQETKISKVTRVTENNLRMVIYADVINGYVYVINIING